MPVPRPDRARWRTFEDRLGPLEASEVNYDTDAVSLDAALAEGHATVEGWRLDRHEATLPSEPPGPPLPHGPFAAACDIVRAYDFPDPSLITGVYVTDKPFEDRQVMLLRARFLGLTFWLGVRLTDVVDEMRDTPDGPAYVWGYGYQTLQGHFEMGEIRFSVWKWAESGRVAFRLDAISKTGRIRNPFYWVGFRLFGRHLQLRFARTAQERMQRLVAEALAERPVAEPLETPDTAPARSDPEAARKMEAAQHGRPPE